MKKKTAAMMVAFAVATSAQPAVADPLDPDCTAEKAAKGAAAKAAMGVGGRCSPGETIKNIVQ